MRTTHLTKNTTDGQCAGLVASIGCPRHLEICSAFGRQAPHGTLTYRTEEQAAQRRHEAAAAAGWSFSI